jgi:transposase
MKRILARVNVEIVKRSDQAKSFVVLPKRWIVERTLTWLGRCRRLAKDADVGHPDCIQQDRADSGQDVAGATT